MDLYQPQVASHYEYHTMKPNAHSLITQTKLDAFYMMSQLEGWCSENKASILIEIISMLKPKTVVEIGVWGGKSLVPMAYALKKNGKGKAYGIDPWSASESIEGMDGINYQWWNAADHEGVLKGLQVKIIEFDLQEEIELLRTSSQKAPIIPNIDVLHIDGNHSEKAAKIDVLKWVPLVRKGGVIVFDDITWGTNITAVQWLNENCIKLAEFNDSNNDWAIWIKP